MTAAVLQILSPSELLAAVGQLGLSVGDLSSREQLQAALAASPDDSLTAVFSGYKRERLKELCRALGLPDSGKEKGELIARLLSASPSQQQLGLGLSAASSPATEAKPKRGRPAGTQKEASKTTHIAGPCYSALVRSAARAARKSEPCQKSPRVRHSTGCPCPCRLDALHSLSL